MMARKLVSNEKHYQTGKAAFLSLTFTVQKEKVVGVYLIMVKWNRIGELRGESREKAISSAGIWSLMSHPV